MKHLTIGAIALFVLGTSSCGILKQPTQLPSHILRLPGSIIRNTKNLVTEAPETVESVSQVALKQAKTGE